MKRVGSILLTSMLCLSMVASPVLASKGKGNSDHSKSAKQSYSKVEKSLKTSLDKITPEQKEKIKERFQKLNKQAVKYEFTDTKAHWAKNDIQKLQKIGWIKGYEDMTFRPSTPVSSVEAMVMAVRLAESLAVEVATEEEATEEVATEEVATEEEATEEVATEEVATEEVATEEVATEEVATEEVATEEEATEEVATEEEATEEEAIEEVATEEVATEEVATEEVATEEEAIEEEIEEIPGWASGAAKKAVGLKIVNINRFHSHVQATRAMAAVMLAKALEIQPVDTSEVTFSDEILISPEDVGYIMALKEAGIIKGNPDGKFNPNSSVTRAEMATMLSRIVNMVDNDQVTEESETSEQTNENELTQEVEESTGSDTGETNELEQVTQ